MINPSVIMKLMNLRNKFTEAHPKFAAFISLFFTNGLTEGTVIEITVTKPGEEAIMTNMRVTQEDLEMLSELKNIAQ